MVKKRTARPKRGPFSGEGEVEAGGALEYKVVELSTVDEGSLEQAVNHWVQRGWGLDGVQFAMRESSKRPSMAFVFFTRPGRVQAVEAAGPRSVPRLPPVASEVERGSRASEAWRRLEALAQAGGEED